MTDLFLEAFKTAQDINDAQMSSARYAKLGVLKDLLMDINSIKNNVDFTTYIKIKTLIEGRIEKIKKDIKNYQKYPDPFLDSM
tara:strand:+ start:346 stop:594 length:249 start_codon:yes stop_codon:yes gene_type:complete